MARSAVIVGAVLGLVGLARAEMALHRTPDGTLGCLTFGEQDAPDFVILTGAYQAPRRLGRVHGFLCTTDRVAALGAFLKRSGRVVCVIGGSLRDADGCIALEACGQVGPRTRCAP